MDNEDLLNSEQSNEEIMDDEDLLNLEQSNEEMSEFYNSAKEIIIYGYANGYMIKFLPNKRQLHVPNMESFCWRVDKKVKIERIMFGPPGDLGPLSLRVKFHHSHNINIKYGVGGNYIEASPTVDE